MHDQHFETEHWVPQSSITPAWLRFRVVDQTTEHIVQGPCAMWHHTHSFHDSGTGTLIRDRVLYRLPLGRLGCRFGGPFVSRDVKKIFECRAERTTDLLRAATGTAA